MLYILFPTRDSMDGRDSTFLFLVPVHARTSLYNLLYLLSLISLSRSASKQKSRPYLSDIQSIRVFGCSRFSVLSLCILLSHKLKRYPALQKLSNIIIYYLTFQVENYASKNDGSDRAYTGQNSQRVLRPSTIRKTNHSALPNATETTYRSTAESTRTIP